MDIPEVPVNDHRQRTLKRLSAPAYELWVRGGLLDELGIRDDGRVRVEIIGGEIVASPGLTVDHGGIVGDIQREFIRAEIADAAFPWRPAQNIDFNLDRIAQGYIPDLVVVDAESFREARKAKTKFLIPRQLSLAVEVTSRSNANEDREPGPKRERPSKWNGYALVGVPYYLLIDRDPRRLSATLYSTPDSEIGAYRNTQEWTFGETITLPDPFSIEIPTDEWEPWDED